MADTDDAADGLTLNQCRKIDQLAFGASAVNAAIH
jgi:hypothetical protein